MSFYFIIWFMADNTNIMKCCYSMLWFIYFFILGTSPSLILYLSRKQGQSEWIVTNSNKKTICFETNYTFFSLQVSDLHFSQIYNFRKSDFRIEDFTSFCVPFLKNVKPSVVIVTGEYHVKNCNCSQIFEILLLLFRTHI